MKRVFIAFLFLAAPAIALGQTTWTVAPDSGLKIENPSIDSTGKLNFTVSPTTAPPPPPPPPPTTITPTAEWTLKQASISGTTVADASGNGNSATVVGGPLTFGSVGANFNGSSQYIDSMLSVTSPQLTVSAWFNATSLANYNPRIVANSHTDSDKNGFQMMFRGGGASGFFDVGNGTAEGRAEWSKQLTTGTLYHYVGVYDGSTVKAYINGSQVASATFSGGAVAAGNGPRLSVARNPTYNSDFFSGAISDVRIYKTALSASDVLALYQAGAK